MRYIKKYASTVLLTAVFLAGSVLLLYPTVSDHWNARHQSSAIAGYETEVRKLAPEDYSALIRMAEEYNQGLVSNTGRFHPDPEEDAYYRTLLLTGTSDVIATVEVPSIEVKLPVYHGTEEGVLQNGIGHIEGSSLPIGGPSTHSVLSGHRGLPSARLFTDLNKVKEGDIFRIHVLGMTLTYQTDEITVVEPQQVEGLAIEPGADYCTLVTCTPYGINSHRLLVRGKRVVEDGMTDGVNLAEGASAHDGAGPEVDPAAAGAASGGASTGADPASGGASAEADPASSTSRDWKNRMEQVLIRWYPVIVAGLLFAVFLLILTIPVLQKRMRRRKRRKVPDHDHETTQSNLEKGQGGDRL